MKVVCVGGGPAGLSFAILMKLRNPDHVVTVHERNPAGTTHGWAVVFSADFLDDLHAADPRTARLVQSVAHVCREERVCLGDRPPVHLGGLYSYSVDRGRLLGVLVRRATELGVDVRFEDTVTGEPDADLVVASDGAGSAVRAARPDAFGTTVDTGRNRYAWLGTERVLPGFTFAFERTGAGWVWCHAYPSSGSTSTFIVECGPDTWAGLGLDDPDPASGLRRLETVFARHLDGHPLRLPRGADDGRSPWLRFRTIRNERWVDGNTVLLGDAAHTTHFSIASGTVLAVGDAVALADAVATHADLAAGLAAFERRRRAELAVVQQAALVSTRWFEDVERHLDTDDAVRFAYDLFNRQSDQPAWRYPLHVLTQNPVLRRGRRAITDARRLTRTMRRGQGA